MAQDSDRSGRAAAWLLVGLGNPGAEYALNRHNIGFLALDHAAERWGQRPSDFRAKFGSDLLQVDYGRGANRTRLILQKPLRYMNVSGGPVQEARAFFRIEPRNLIVLHDDIDLPTGRVKVKKGGGHGGHNGLRSISQALGPDYLRVRGGVGRPGGAAGQGEKKTEGKQDRVVGHVLGNFNRSEQKDLPLQLDTMVDAIEDILDHGVEHAMNRFNGDGPDR
ncbi:MAG: aminoacyl-tRNA hydrolase [Polyangia bacterium]